MNKHFMHIVKTTYYKISEKHFFKYKIIFESWMKRLCTKFVLEKEKEQPSQGISSK